MFMYIKVLSQYCCFYKKKMFVTIQYLFNIILLKYILNVQFIRICNKLWFCVNIFNLLIICFVSLLCRYVDVCALLVVTGFYLNIQNSPSSMFDCIIYNVRAGVHVRIIHMFRRTYVRACVYTNARMYVYLQRIICGCMLMYKHVDICAHVLIWTNEWVLTLYVHNFSHTFMPL